MSQYKYAEIADTVYFWFAANATTGAAGDGATPLYDVRLAGAAADAAPTASGTPTLLTNAGYTDGLHEIAIDTTGYSAGEYAVFCTLTISTVNPAGFCGSFKLRTAGTSALNTNVVSISNDAITAASINTGALTADAFAADAIVAATLATGALTADAFAADAIVAATLATGAITADAFAANAITNAAVADDVDVNVKTITAGAITAAAIADAAIDNATFAADVGSTAYATNIVALAADKAIANAALATAANLATATGYIDTEVASILAAVDTEIGTLTTELAKVPKSDSTVSWNATALAAIADAVHDEAVDGTVTFRQSTRLANSANGGKLSGAATTTVAVRDLADTKDRVSATVDANGNRTAVTLTLT